MKTNTQPRLREWGKKIRFQILTNWSLINNYTKSLETYSISIIKVKSKIKSKDRTRRKQTVKWSTKSRK